MIQRQSKEESQALWQLELDSAKNVQLSAEHMTLLAIVNRKIEDYSLTYVEYVGDIADYLDKAKDEEPKVVIANMINHLIEKYGNSEEVRSEQSENGLDTNECNGIIGESIDDGSSEVCGEQLAEPSGVLEEVQSSTVETSDGN